MARKAPPLRVGMGGTFDTSPMPDHPELATPANVRALQAQLNRFRGTALGNFVPQVIKVTGELDFQTAQTAIKILYARALVMAKEMGVERGSGGAVRNLINNTTKGLVDPVAFIRHDVREAAEVVQRYADNAGLPPASPLAQLISDPRVLYVGAGALALLLLKGRLL